MRRFGHKQSSSAMVVVSFASVLALAGLAWFRSGFLLARTGLAAISTCHDPPPPLLNGTSPEECWIPRPHPVLRRAVILVVDALRHDFAAPIAPRTLAARVAADPGAANYLGRLPVLDPAHHAPGHARLFRAYADPPTTTLQRIKALTTGSLPTFVEMGANFGGAAAIRDDSVLLQIASTNRSVVFMGDDTWLPLYEHLMARSFDAPSLDVWDLDTVDNMVTAHLYDEMRHESKDWALLIGHMLGVDHVGHRYYPAHPAMATKLDQVNGVIARAVHELPDDAVLVVLGDHGMDAKGDHGGESEWETGAALWMFSKHPIFGTDAAPPHDQGDSNMNQIDLVPTLSLLLGLPIPFENIGSLIADAFPAGSRAAAVQANAAQVRRYLLAYAAAAPGDFPPAELGRMLALFDDDQYLQFLSAALALCRDVWARFDEGDMAKGLGLLLAAVLSLLWVLPRTLSSSSSLLRQRSISSAVTVAVVAYPVLLGFMYYSDSFVIYEDALTASAMSVALLLPFLGMALSSSASFRSWTPWIAALALHGVSRRVTVCRDEQIPGCVNTFSGSSTSSGWLGMASSPAIAGVLALVAYAATRAAGPTRRAAIGSAALLVAYWVADHPWGAAAVTGALPLLQPLPLPRAVAVWVARVHAAWWAACVVAAVRRRHRMHPQQDYNDTAEEEDDPWTPLVLMLVAQTQSPAAITGLVAVAVAVAAAASTPTNPLIAGTVAHLAVRTGFFTTGHQAALASVQWSVSHVGLWATHPVLSPLLVLTNTVGHVAVVVTAVLMAGQKRQPAATIVSALVGLEIWHATHASVAAAVLRRHLMVWRVFAPRWMLAALLLVAVLVSVGLYAIGSVCSTWWTRRSLPKKAK
ncbi:alkaline-phosphatase-like protein [Blastocladiella britannica]|nr:alkaline-phosphatase-like protein [Blastocladiella britannica]